MQINFLSCKLSLCRKQYTHCKSGVTLSSSIYLLMMPLCFQTYSRPNGNSLNPPMPVSNFLRIPREKENSTLESTPPAAGGSSSQYTNTGIDTSGFSLLSTRCFIALNPALNAIFRPQKKLSDGQTKFSITGSGTTHFL